MRRLLPRLFAALLLGATVASLVLASRMDPVVAADGDRTITTFSGGPGRGDALNLSLQASYLAADDTNLYLAGTPWNVVHAVDHGTGTASVVAGSGEYGMSGDGGPATNAALNGPGGMDVGPDGLYIVDRANCRVRLVAADGTITTVAGTSCFGAPDDTPPFLATEAVIAPTDVAVDGAGNLYIAEPTRNIISRVDATTGEIGTFAGTGAEGSGSCNGDTPGSTPITAPDHVAVDDAGNNVYFIHRVVGTDAADDLVCRVQTVVGVGSFIETWAGGEGTPFVEPYCPDGVAATGTCLWNPQGLAVSSGGNLFIADYWNGRLRMVEAPASPTEPEPAPRMIWEYGQFIGPVDVALTPNDTLYVTDSSFAVVYRLDVEVWTEFAGNGFYKYGGDTAPAVDAQFDMPGALAFGPDGDLYVADDETRLVRRVDAATGNISTIAGVPGGGDFAQAAAEPIFGATGLAVDGDGNVYIADGDASVIRVEPDGTLTTFAGGYQQPPEPNDPPLATDAPLNMPHGLAIFGGDVYIAEFGGDAIRRVDIVTRVIDTVVPPDAGLFRPAGIDVDTDGNLYVADSGNCLIRRVEAGTGSLSTVGSTQCPTALATLPSSSDVQLARLAFGPADVAVDRDGNVYFTDESSVQRVLASSPDVTETVAGDPFSRNFSGDGGQASEALLNDPQGLAIGPTDGDLYIGDTGNSRVRRVDFLAPPGPPATDADLGIVMNLIGPSTPTAGAPVTFQFAVDNAGPADATGTTVTQQLPSGWTFNGSDPGGICGSVGTTVTCSLGTLPVDGSTTFSTVSTPSQAGTTTHQASVAGDQVDPIIENDSDTLLVVVEPALCPSCGGPTPSPTTGPTTAPTSAPSASPQATSGPIVVSQTDPPAPSAEPSQQVLGGTVVPRDNRFIPTEGHILAPGQETPAPTEPPEAPAESPGPQPEPEPEPEGPAPDGGGPGDAISTFARSFPGFADLTFDPGVMAQSAMLSLAALFLMAFPGQLFNSTLEKHNDEVRSWFAPLAVGVRRFGEGFDAFWQSPFGIAAFLIISGLLYALLDPGFGLSIGGLVTLIGMTLGVVAVTLAFGIPLLFAHRRDGERPVIRALPGTLLVGVACVVVSRLVNVQPGYMYGLIIGFAFAQEIDPKRESRLAAIGAALMLAIAVLAFIGIGLIRQSGDEGLLAIIVETALAATLLAGLEQVVFSLLPLRFLPGAEIFNWNRAAWALLMLLSLFAFFHILINPKNGYLSDTTRTPLMAAFLLLLAFGLFSIGFWAYFRFRPQRPSASPPSASGPPAEPSAA